MVSRSEELAMDGLNLNGPSLTYLPDEIIQQILIYIPPLDTIGSVQQVCRRLNRLANEALLWRYHCKVGFKYWDSKHRIKQKFLGSVNDMDWKTLFAHRKMVDKKTTETLDSILQGQTNRIQKFGTIGNFGYDAKDTLLRHCHTSDGVDDVLARR
jgi:F-box protein 21